MRKAQLHRDRIHAQLGPAASERIFQKSSESPNSYETSFQTLLDVSPQDRINATYRMLKVARCLSNVWQVTVPDDDFYDFEGVYLDELGRSEVQEVYWAHFELMESSEDDVEQPEHSEC